MLISAIASLGLAAPALASTKRCQATGPVLARKAGAVVWSVTKGRGAHEGNVRVYLCSAREPGRHVLVVSGNPGMDPAVGHVKSAGHFLAFVLTTGPGRTSSLFVYNTATGRKELSDYDSCVGIGKAAQIECFSQNPSLRGYELASDGWIAEVFVYPVGFETTLPTANYEGLIASNSAKVHYPIDFGYNIADLSLSGTTLTWTSDLGGASSATLGSDLATPSAPQSLSTCSAVTQADVAPILGVGAASSSTSTENCSYTSQTNPSMTLSIGIQTGLSASQISANEAALPNSPTLVSWLPDENFRVFENNTESATTTQSQLWGFVNGTEVTMTLTSSNGPGGQPANAGGEALAWLADVAYDRLFQIPVTRSQ